ncbi:MAG TPA: peptidoglycan DD-metalloendopeptidase family protein [Holophagaceae bacterium]|nr:peptidoglycan DD-metalloendopeptidase family protein [Holophagaceae bacterium]
MFLPTPPALTAPAPLPKAAPVPGGVALVKLPASDQTPQVTFKGERVLVRREGKGWVAVVGLKLSQAPGSETLEVDGKPFPFTVQTKHYPEQRVTVKNPRLVNPNPEDEARIAKEDALSKPAWKAWPEGRTSALRFRPPTAGRLTASFGMRRIFNGEPRSPHPGLDIAAPAGQKVVAPGDGVVVLTGDFFYAGKFVMIAHGEGVVSLLGHLSRIDAKVGDVLKAGTPIGRVGMTGRATGPHLHWSLSLNNARVDPSLFLR